MFVVVGVVVAYAARVPCVVRPHRAARLASHSADADWLLALPCQVITTTVRGRSSLHTKVLEKLALMPDGTAMRATCHVLPGGRRPAATRLLVDALGGSSSGSLLCDRGALFVADTCTQVTRATEALELLRVKRAARKTGARGQFLLFVDEADAMQRTDGDTHEPTQLERCITTFKGGQQDASGTWRKLGDDPENRCKALLSSSESFFGPQVCVSISATLLPVFLGVLRDAQKRTEEHAEASEQARAAGAPPPLPPVPAVMHPFYTMSNMKDYLGTSALWRPFEQPVCAEDVMEDGSGVAAEGQEHMCDAFLPPGALKSSNMGIDPGGLVLALYNDAVARPRSLLLDVTVTRVHANNNVRAHAGVRTRVSLHAISRKHTRLRARRFSTRRQRCGATAPRWPRSSSTAPAAPSSCRPTSAAAAEKATLRSPRTRARWRFTACSRSWSAAAPFRSSPARAAARPGARWARCPP
jgi:hypothetical protein